MTQTLLTAGIACLIAAIIGGGLKAYGIEFPLLQSTRRQALLALLGAAFLGAAWYVDNHPKEPKEPPKEVHDAEPTTPVSLEPTPAPPAPKDEAGKSPQARPNEPSPSGAGKGQDGGSNGTAAPRPTPAAPVASPPPVVVAPPGPVTAPPTAARPPAPRAEEVPCDALQNRGDHATMDCRFSGGGSVTLTQTSDPLDRYKVTVTLDGVLCPSLFFDRVEPARVNCRVAGDDPSRSHRISLYIPKSLPDGLPVRVTRTPPAP